MTQRPTIAPGVLAAVISAVPDRLQKRLDREPRAAENWEWQESGDEWKIAAGEETVLLPATTITDMAQVKCSCLLSPRCFHVLAALSVIEIASHEAGAEGVNNSVEVLSSRLLPSSAATAAESFTSDELSESVTESQCRAVQQMFDACTGILATGLRAAGTVLQSRLLRAIHECRSEGLHRAAGGGLRLMNNLRLQRDEDDRFNSSEAVRDLTDVLETCVRLLRQSTTSAASPAPPSRLLEWIGIARRTYEPLSSLKLHAVFCEPILTRSGYSGVVTWLMADDGWVGTVSDVQPGDAKRIPQAWQSGVTLAGLSMSHRDLSQKCLLISKATRSIDGRLGGGESARAVAVDGQGWDAAPIAKRFAMPLSDQIRQVFARSDESEFLKPAGTDLVFFVATVAGYSGQELIVQDVASRAILRLGIAIDDDSVGFRSSLQMMSRAPGLTMRCVGQIDPSTAGRVTLLAVSNVQVEESPDEGANTRQPALALPSPLRVASIGLQFVTRSHLSHAELQPVNVEVSTESPMSNIAHDDALERWLQAIVIGGRHAVPQGLITTAVRDATRLRQYLRPVSASLLHNLTKSSLAASTDLSGIRFATNPSNLALSWLAAASGARRYASFLQSQRWLQLFSETTESRTFSDTLSLPRSV